MKKMLMFLVAAMGLALSTGTAKAQVAPVFGQVRVTVPFQFYAGDTQFPAGQYVIKRLNEIDPSVLTVQPVSGKATAILLVQLQDNKVKATSSDVSFNKYGDRYFISGVTVEGYSNGSMMQPSNFENLVAKGEVRGAGRIVPAQHRW